MAKKGLYANIHARRKAGKPARKPSSPPAPSKQDFVDSAKTASNKKSAMEMLVSHIFTTMHIDRGWRLAQLKWTEDAIFPLVEMELPPVWGTALLF